MASENPKKSNFETDNEKIFNITELAMLRVMTMMTGELDATDLLLNFSDFNFRKGLKESFDKMLSHYCRIKDFGDIIDIIHIIWTSCDRCQ